MPSSSLWPGRLPVPAEGECLATHGGGRRKKGLKPDYAIDPETGCWEWLKFKVLNGYPHGRAHRKYWERANGPIPEGHQIHHVCRNTSCVNPGHLEAMPRDEHLREHFLHDRGLSEQDVHDIRELARDRSVRAGDVAARYGIHEETVRAHWRARTWQDDVGTQKVQPNPGVCPVCNGPVYGNRNRVFCSGKHRTDYNRRKRIDAQNAGKRCAVCDTSIEHMHGSTKYCDDCRADAYKGKVAA